MAGRAISRDETVYPEPNSFKPERFLEPVDSEMKKRMDPRNYVFGAGRRRCPGTHLVEAGLWLVIARVVATLDIRKKVVNGVEVEPNASYDNALLRYVSHISFCSPPIVFLWRSSLAPQQQRSQRFPVRD